MTMVYQTREQAVPVFAGLFQILIDDPDIVARMRAASLTVRMIQTKPDFQLHVSPDGVRVDDDVSPAAITIKMSCDTADQLWGGRLLMPLALATGRVRVRGSLARVLEFVPLLQPAFDRYPALAAAAEAAG